ncbi:uncharacterized protein G2W53_021032 [Senna tora]|uniref:Uncharacterized protein n=1 Tax=Senna tora TaxID=362788 RepID=A0A834WJ81_9FABA|nr:uncharacterized protein G2W53_021032 [Senna tora]
MKEFLLQIDKILVLAALAALAVLALVSMDDEYTFSTKSSTKMISERVASIVTSKTEKHLVFPGPPR